ncbi:MAG: cell wall biogenesis protein [Rhodospirillaceae bacterium]|nr:cell wall biogenesis protein [Rhodospirillaceae bacterium]|tara:strand:+ start:7298 stop:8458 length:1161 start_codon:yes stop_codon:yes gene_type:complete
MPPLTIPFGCPLLDQKEIDAATKVLSGPILAHGPVCLEFEEAFADYIQVEHAISVASGTAALHLCLFASEIGPGDEIIVPAMSHVATAHAVEYCGAKPIFADVSPTSGNITPEGIREIITDKTKAVMVVHFLGLPCDMDPINAIAQKLGVFVIEDAALAMGAQYGSRMAGALAQAACFSFYPIKHITSIEGGMVTTNNGALAELIRQRKAFGYNHSYQTRMKPGVYDVPVLGFNYRMNEVEAAVGLCQLDKLNERLKIRKHNYNALKSSLAEIDEITVFEPVQGKSASSYYCLNAILPADASLNRDKIVQELTAQNIGSSVHYPGPIPLMTYYREKYDYKPGQFQTAEWLANQTISLPVAPHVPDGFEEHIAATMKNAIYKALHED